MRFEFHPEALEEYREAARWYGNREPDLALRFVGEIEDAIGRILKGPASWRVIEDDVRRGLTHVFPYAILYTIESASSRCDASFLRAIIEAMVSNQLIDLSHTIEHGLITYKGLPAPIICDFLSREQSKAHYAPGTEFQIGKIEMVANTGTYLDSPFHRFEEGRDLSQLELTSLADLEGQGLRAKSEEREIDVDIFKSLELRGKAVLIHTGWAAHWRTDKYFEGHPFLTKDAAQLLADQGAALVGIDSYNIDDTADLSRPAHSILLAAGIPIVEHLCNLDQLPTDRFKFFAVPAKIKGFGTFPVRAFAIV